MRLLKIGDGGELSLVEHFGAAIPPYAILSHTWGTPTEEVSYKDILKRRYTSKSSYAKVQFCACQATKDGWDHIWVDTCCIDKSSSAELSEAINSMFRWYTEAAVCYVYMSDVKVVTVTGADGDSWLEREGFCQSKWFTRGWTLQELIAPSSVLFFSREGVYLGDRVSLCETIREVTGIPLGVLRDRNSDDFSTATRLGWVQGRETTREEDMVYSILGLVNLYMPLIYGEGRANAYSRMLRELPQELSRRRRSHRSNDLIVQRVGVSMDGQGYTGVGEGVIRDGHGNIIVRSGKIMDKQGNVIVRGIGLTMDGNGNITVRSGWILDKHGNVIVQGEGLVMDGQGNIVVAHQSYS